LATTIISFVVVIGIIVFVHELGHFLAAKLSGVRVEVFSLGFPPKMIGHKFGETEYQLAWIPLGGYVKMSGMSDESFDETIDLKDPRGYTAQPFGKKVFIITAGVVMNIILAFVIYALLTWYGGVAKLSGTALTLVSSYSPAEQAGLKVGDVIVEIAGQPVTEWEQLTERIRALPGQSTVIGWKRGDSLMSAQITPTSTSELNLSTGKSDTVGKIGVLGSFTTEVVGPIKSLGYGAAQVWFVIRINVASVLALFSGNAHLSDLTGPIGIAKLSGESARSGWMNFVSFIAMISVSIGFLNIMPVPMLDGGHLVFMVIEAIIRKQIPEKIKINIMKVGLAALIMLVALVSYHDIVRVFLTKE